MRRASKNFTVQQFLDHADWTAFIFCYMSNLTDNLAFWMLRTNESEQET